MLQRFTAIVMTLLLAPTLSFAQMGHMSGTAGMAHSGHMEEKARPAMVMASTEVFADGIQATFTVMANENHRNMLKNMKMKEDIQPGTTHNIMVLIRDDKTGKELNGAPVTLTVIDQDDNEQTRPGSYKEMMRTYDGYFNLKEKGKYRILATFEAEGRKREVGISYERS